VEPHTRGPGPHSRILARIPAPPVKRACEQPPLLYCGQRAPPLSESRIG
jgi:hypothetical protein